MHLTCNSLLFHTSFASPPIPAVHIPFIVQSIVESIFERRMEQKTNFIIWQCCCWLRIVASVFAQFPSGRQAGRWTPFTKHNDIYSCYCYAVCAFYAVHLVQSKKKPNKIELCRTDPGYFSTQFPLRKRNTL